MNNVQEAFEAFVLTQPGWSIEKFDGAYLWPSIETAWVAWQACAGTSLPCGSRAEWHDKAWELYEAKMLGDAEFEKLSIHTIRVVLDATYDALYVPDAIGLGMKEVHNPATPTLPCFKCGVPTNETQSVHGVGHYQCFMGGRK